MTSEEADYMWDVFVSYPRGDRSAPERWVSDFFFPVLAERLAGEMGSEPRIFIDRVLPSGTQWQSALRRALHHSRMLIPVFTPQYFRSKWCLAELQTMMSREEYLGLGTDRNPDCLVFPVLLNDGQHFASYTDRYQCADMRDYSYTAKAFKKSKHFMKFEALVQTLALQIAHRIPDAPDFADGFPRLDASAIDMEDDKVEPPFRIPRF